MKKLFLPLLVFVLLNVEVLPDGCEGGNAEHFRQRAAAKERRKQQAIQKQQDAMDNSDTEEQ